MNGFDYHAPRARQARLGKLLGAGWFQYVALLSAVLLALLSTVLLLDNQMIGWIVVGLAGPLLALVVWGQYLRHLPRGRTDDIADILDPAMLARLPKDPSPQDIARVVMSQAGGKFFASRFMLGRDFLTQIAGTDPAGSAAIWSRALTMRNETGELTSGAVAAALVLETENVDQYLAHVGIDSSDMPRGVLWLQHIEDLIKAHATRKKNAGGIGRDWAFGFTPLLERLGHNLSDQVAAGAIARKLEAREQIVDQMMQILAQSGRRNVTLVGQLGSGKTKLVHMLAERLLDPDASVPRGLAYNQVIALDPSMLISRAQGRGQLEDMVLRLCGEALSAKNIILFLDDAHLFFEEGNGSVDLSTALSPFLDGGALKIVLAVDEQRWTQIVQRNGSLAQYLNRVIVAPANEQETQQVMENQIILLEHQYKTLYTYQALKAAYELSGRYIADQVMPGRALNLLESAAHNTDNGLVTRGSVERALEQTRGVKVSTANTQDERDTLLNLEDKIHERMINQTHAVRAVSDALRRARAGVRNPTRPIGTFLFLGPTGVGKTELAKSIASVYFGDEQSIVRLDLNEYVRSEDVARLIADPAQDSHSLTAQVSQRPFSVVLLDEIEKAHPEVLTTLLQVLDEGILRDINNREVSFRDCVIIATSNAGAERIIQHIQAGEALEQFEQQFIDEMISSGAFRPEFLNRFDEITLFRPLDQGELKQVIDLIISGINKTLAPQKLTVHVDEDAKLRLVEAGYDARLGARPMRRIVQRTVENIIADHVLQQTALPGSTISISLAEVDAALARSSAK